MQAPLIPSDLPALRRALAVSVLVHVVLGAVLAVVHVSPARKDTELVDIEVAPPPPEVEALPEEVARVPEEGSPGKDEVEPASTVPTPPSSEDGIPVDAGVDAPPDAPIDAPIDAPVDAPKRKPDAAIDAPPLVAAADAGLDAGVDDAAAVALADAGVDAPAVALADAGGDAPAVALADAGGDAPAVALADAGVDAPAVALADAGVDAPAVATGDPNGGAGSGSAASGSAGSGSAAANGSGGTAVASAGSGAGSGTGVGSGAAGIGAGSGSGAGTGSASAGASIAMQNGAGSGSAGQTNEPAVEGAPTTAGTAANLLTYFPRGHMLTVLLRFDRLRGTEWAAQAERLIAPMPDYQFLFGGQAANITDKLDTLVVSTFSPKDINATTLVGRTQLGRSGLRDLLSAAAPVTWSATKSGLLGKRSRAYRGDKRVFVSPYQGWFLLAQPTDLGSLATVTTDLDAVVATAKQPAWLAGIRTIEKESGTDARGPALVVTLALDGKRFDLGENDFGLGIKTLPTPDRLSLAMELVKQGWLVRGNMRFGSEKDAKEFIAAAETVRDRVGDSTAIQLVIGKPLARVVKNLSFARTGGRVSYATSVSIADARAILAVTAQQLDGYFRP